MIESDLNESEFPNLTSFKLKKENRAKNNPYQQPFTPRQASTVVPQQAPLVQVYGIRAES